MIKRLLTILFIALYSLGKSQCPQIYNSAGTLTNNPSFIYCQSGAYSMDFQSTATWGPYTINWGDGTPPAVAAGYTGNTIITHVYSPTVAVYMATLTIPGLGCVQSMSVIMEQAVAAGAQNFGGVTTFCAPGTVTVTNISTNVSPTTVFTWDWGDGTAIQTFNSANQGQNVIHTFASGSVPSCQRQITLKASNACRPIPNPLNLFVDIYDVDIAVNVGVDQAVKCYPENTFTLTNTTTRQCFAEGNTFQRQERWNLGNYWGFGHDSIIDWRPWPPTQPLVITYPVVSGSTNSFNVLLMDSNKCGVTQKIQSISVVPPPTAGLIKPAGNLCQSTSLTFTNTSSAGYTYQWDFGDGGGFQNLGSGNKSHTYASPGTYTVSVAASLPGGGAACSSTANVVVTIFGSPVANFSLTPATGCSSLTNVVFTDLSTGASLWNWKFGNTVTSTLQIPPPQNYLTTGAFVATLVVTGTTSCVNTKTASIVVRSTPVPNFPIISPCVGAIGNFTNTSTVTGTTAISNYTWSFGDGSAVSNSTNSAHTYTAPGTYTVNLIAATPFCNDNVSKVVVVNVKPTANFVFTPTINCPPFAATFTNTSSNATNYLWMFGTSATATSNATSPSFTYANSTQNYLNYTVTLIASTGLGCSDVTTQSLSVKPKPVASFVVSTSGGCSPLATTFTNNSLGAATYSWSFGDAVGSTSVNPVHSYSNTSLLLQTNSITLVATNSIACTDTALQTIQVFPQPLTTFTMTPGSGCTPLVVNFPSVPGIVSYTWNFGDGSPILVASSPTLHVFTNTTTVNQTYTVTLTASNAFGCVDMSSKVPLIYPKPVPNYAVVPAAGCSPLSTTMTNVSTGASTYLWKYGDGATSTSTTASHTYTNPSHTADQSYTCTLIAYTNFGCSDSIKKSLQVYYTPVASFTLNNPQCTSPTITFTNTTIGAAVSSWTFGDASPLSASLNPVHTYTNNSLNNITYSVQLNVITPNACSSVAYGYPVIYAHPVANFLMTPTVGCSPLSSTLTNTSLYAHSYLWRFGDGTSTATTVNTSHTYTNTTNLVNQTYSCTVIAFNNNGCKDSIKQTVMVYYKPKAIFTETDPRCTSQTINFTNASLGASLNTWTFGDGTATSTLVSPAHSYTNTGLNNVTFTAQLVVSTPSLCADTAYGHPVIFAHPIADFILTPTVGCSPLTLTSFNTSSAAHTYLWKFSDGAPTVTVQNVGHSYVNTSHSSDQTYTTTLVAYNNNGCRDSLSVPLLLHYKPESSFALDTPGCSPKIITFTNTSQGGQAYTWDFGDGSGSASTGSILTHQFINTTLLNQTFTLSLIATSPYNCKDTVIVRMAIHPVPHFDISAMRDSGCAPLSVIFPRLGGVSSHRWSFDNSVGFGDDGNGDVSNTFTEGRHNIRLIAKDVYGCVDTAYTHVVAYPKPKAQFNAYPLKVYIPNEATNMVNQSSSGTSPASTFTSSWSFGDGSTSDDINPSHTYTIAGNYAIILVVNNAYGCRDTTNLGQDVVALDQTTVFMPNAFTPDPNGSHGNEYKGANNVEVDRHNWLFHPIVTGAEKYEFSIYSRWGELLFDTRNSDQGWDGYYKGEICTQDVYIWKIVATFADGKIYNKTGDLLLLR